MTSGPTISLAAGASREATATPNDLAQQLTRAAEELGFSRVGFAPVDRLERGRAALERWLEQGYHGALDYLVAGPDRADPRQLLATARTVMAVAVTTPGNELVALKAGPNGRRLTGTVARYAVGADYHDVVRGRLDRLAARATELVGRPVAARACADSAPLLEREVAERAGVGFIAKSTMLIVPGIGTYALLGELLLDVDVEPTRPAMAPSGCGSCRACLDACPTHAFVGPYELDARRCISYLTIENRGPIPRDLRTAIGTRVFGCDVCQEVCPFNASPKPRAVIEPLRPRGELPVVELGALLLQGSKAHRRWVRGTALRRTSRNALSRNAAVALGNTGDPDAVPPLTTALARHVSPLVRAHAAWALGQLASMLSGEPVRLARDALRNAADADADPMVREECRLALIGDWSAASDP